MDCPETKKSLSDYLDDRLGPEEAEEVSAHLADCTACRAELADLRRIDALLGGFADPPVDESRLDTLWSRVNAQLDVPEAAAAPPGAAALGPAPFVMRPQPATQPRWLVPTLAVVGVATVAVTVFAVILLVRSPDRRQAPGGVASADDAMRSTRSRAMDVAMAAGMDATDDGSDAMGKDAMDDGSDAMGKDAMDAMDAMGKDAMDDGSDAMSSMATGSRSRRRRRRGSSSGRVMSSGRTRTMSAGSTMSSGRTMSSGSSMSGGSSLQDLLRRAGGSMSSSGGSSGGASNQPKRLSMGKIRSGVGRILGSARACGHRYKVPGTLRVRVIVKGSTGRVSSASILGSFRGTPTGRCVARAFRRARFSKFQSSSQSFIFPLIFR